MRYLSGCPRLRGIYPGVRNDHGHYLFVCSVSNNAYLMSKYRIIPTGVFLERDIRVG